MLGAWYRLCKRGIYRIELPGRYVYGIEPSSLEYLLFVYIVQFINNCGAPGYIIFVFPLLLLFRTLYDFSTYERYAAYSVNYRKIGAQVENPVINSIFNRMTYGGFVISTLAALAVGNCIPFAI